MKQKKWRMTTQGMSNQLSCNIESHSHMRVLSSKQDSALQNSSVGDELLWKILCHVANLSLLFLPLGCAQLAKNHDHANKNLIIKKIMILWFTTYVLISFLMNLFIHSCYLFYASMFWFGVLIKHDYWIKTWLYRIWLYI